VFAMRDGNEWRPVSYSMDVVSQIPWDKVDLQETLSTSLSAIEEKDTEQVAGISEDIHEVIRQKNVHDLRKGSIRLDSIFLARHLMDLVPNPWVAHEIGESVLKKFIRQYGEPLVTNNFVFIIEELRKNLSKEKDRLAREVFHDLICQSKLRFLVILNEIGFKLPKKKFVKTSKAMNKITGMPLERSLFDLVPEDDFNELEKEVAWYLEGQDKLLWWYRNEPKKDYAVQGWRKNRIFADFIFTDTDGRPESFNRVFVVETKGIHLKDNEDTTYKKDVFQVCNKMAKKTTRTKLGLELDTPNIEFHVIHGDEWKNRLNELFSPVN
jgi:type III restriction enzyme